MKKISAFLLIFVLSAMFMLAGAMPALAANDQVDIDGADVKYSKLDISNIKLSSADKSYLITIDGDALKAAAEKGKNFRISMDNVTLAFSSSAMYTDAYKKAAAAGYPVQIRLHVKTNQSIDMGKYFTSGLNNNLMLTTKCTELSAELYVSGRKSADIYQFAAPVSFILDYNSIWNSANTVGKPQSGLTLAWYDLHKKTSSYPQWVRLATKLDLSNRIATGQDIYACGIITPIVCTDLNNAGGSVNGGGNTNTSSGIDSHWAAGDIRQMQSYGIVPADIDSSVLNKAITRDEFVAYLVKTLALPENVELAGKFRDVSQSNPYYKEIYTGVKAGLVNGTSADTFNPQSAITRQEMAAFFTRTLELKDKTVSTDKTKLNTMKDVSAIAAWAKDSCAVAVNSGLISGQQVSGGVAFAPKANTTWAESVVMLNRLRAAVR